MKKFSTLVLFSFFFSNLVFSDVGFITDFSNQTGCTNASFSAIYNESVANGTTWTLNVSNDGGNIITGLAAGSSSTVVGGSGASYTLTVPADGNGFDIVSLAIINMTSANDGATITVTSSTGVDPDTDGTLTVNRINTQPSDLSNICEGNNTSQFSIALSASGDIQWQRDDGSGFANVGGSSTGTSSTYTINAVGSGGAVATNDSDGDMFRAVVSFSGCSDINSDQASLEVLDNLADQNNLAAGNVPIGGSATFFETFTGTNSTTEYFWTVNGTNTATLTGDDQGPTVHGSNINIGGTHLVSATTETVGIAAGITQAKITLMDQGGGSQHDFTLMVSGSMPCGGGSNSSATITALPIELLYFEGRADDRSVRLEWATASELNNDYFTIERSFDGERFNAVGEVKGIGTSFTESTYKFIDGSIDGASSNGNVFYRLKQTDFDGNFSYADVIIVKLEGIATFNIHNVSVQGSSISVDYSSPSTLDVTASVFDLNGKLLGNISTHPAVGFNNEIIDLFNLKPGFYILSMENGNQQASKKFVKF